MGHNFFVVTSTTPLLLQQTTSLISRFAEVVSNTIYTHLNQMLKIYCIKNSWPELHCHQQWMMILLGKSFFEIWIQFCVSRWSSENMVCRSLKYLAWYSTSISMDNIFWYLQPKANTCACIDNNKKNQENEEESHVSPHWKKNYASSVNNVEQIACEYQSNCSVRKWSLSIPPAST